MLYENGIRQIVETDENIGKMISIDIETGEYAIGDTGAQSSSRLRAANPDAALYGARIGYRTAYAIGGAMSRTSKS